MAGNKWWTLVAVCVGTFMLLLDITIVNVALPSIQRDLPGTSFSDVQWVVDAYALTLATLLLTAGALADKLGRRLFFVIGLVVFTAASALCGAATSPDFLITARAIQGVGGAVMFATSLSLLAQAFHGKERGTAFGVWGAITGLAVAVGPLAGGAITEGISWKWIFYLNVPVGIIGVIITLLFVAESKDSRGSGFDVAGVITFSGSLFLLIYALVQGNDKGWGSGLILSMLVGAAVLMLAFVFCELLQCDRAMLDLSLFRVPTFLGSSLVAFCLSGSIFAMFLYITIYFQSILGYSALGAGLRFLPITGLSFFFAAAAGRLTTSVPVRLLMFVGLGLVSGALFTMSGLTAGSHWTALLLGLCLAGAGIGLTNPPIASTAIGVVPPQRSGMASGISSTFRQVGISTGIAGLGAIFTHRVQTAATHNLESAHLPRAAMQKIVGGISTGNQSAPKGVPKATQAIVQHAVKAAFVSGLNEIFVVAGILAGIGAIAGLLLVRGKDFVQSGGSSAGAA